ncbi:MAG: CPBP family intramembrane metalloprotease [Leptospira sp.]|nr:CPBP family intramembrane metalloprotease [Leptospira sp.]
MTSRFFEIFKLTTFALGIILIANLVFSVFYQQFVYTVVLNDRLPPEISENFSEDAANPDISFSESYKKVRESVETLEKQLQSEFRENPNIALERFYDIMLKDKPYLLFVQSLLWFVSFIGLGYLILKKILKFELTDLSEELSIPIILNGIMNGFIIFFIVVVFGVILKLLGVEANPGLFPTKLFKALAGDGVLLLWAIYSVGIITGIIEEVFFRGFLLKTFIDKDLGNEGLLLISVIFGYLHFGVGTTVAVPFLIGLVGLFFGYIYIKNKNIWVSIACHATYNSLGLLLAYAGAENI